MKLLIKFHENAHRLMHIDATNEDASLICAYMLEQNPTWEMLCNAREAVKRSKVINSQIELDDSDVLYVQHLESKLK
jgi:hypothetical protein